MECCWPSPGGGSRIPAAEMRRQAGGASAFRSASDDECYARARSAAAPRGRAQGQRRVTPSPADHAVAEKALPNGDIYHGEFFCCRPHGNGKYLWRDGCMYVGDWRRGKASGKGMFSWPSGATFEGEFRSGRMEGQGTFVGPDGGTYKGSWCADRRHGHGAKHYPNGDIYEGSWRRGLQEGLGRYTWRNGNQYVGEWRAGVISGRGVLIWTSGSCYDGQWENSVPRGNGIFSWPDGRCYVVSWSNSSKSLKQLAGTFFPAPDTAAPPNSPKHRHIASAAARNSASNNDGQLPRICIWESDHELGDITCDIMNKLETSKLYPPPRPRQIPCCFNPEPRKPGDTISKGHKNYDLMLNLQLGIRYSMGKSVSTQTRDLRSRDFDPREKFWTRFPPEGSKITPPHSSVEFKWKDYCPMVFRYLRKLFDVDPADYMMAICGNDALRELSSPGKSGSCFYLTQDDRFIIKTVRKSEVKVLIRMLSSYYQHFCEHKNSLITRFYGVHCVKPIGGQKVRFIVMGNLFCSEYLVHRRFDLKGSSYGRSTNMTEDIDETTTLKDLDLNFVFRLQKYWFRELLEQIDRDSKFLEAAGIMDYSLLVGIHFCDDNWASKLGSQSCIVSEKSLQDDGNMLESFQFTDPVGKGILDARKPLIRLGANMPARAEHVSWRRDSEPYPVKQRGEICNVILCFGIIDILQDYDISKKLEHAYKSLQVDSTSISAVDPKLYSRRFRDFIYRVFVLEDD